jgi:hypothetical protein
MPHLQAMSKLLETEAISSLTLREAARRLGITSDRVRGRTEGLGIRLTRVGRALVMSESDFARVARAVARDRVVPVPA